MIQLQKKGWPDFYKHCIYTCNQPISVIMILNRVTKFSLDEINCESSFCPYKDIISVNALNDFVFQDKKRKNENQTIILVATIFKVVASTPQVEEMLVLSQVNVPTVEFHILLIPAQCLHHIKSILTT